MSDVIGVYSQPQPQPAGPKPKSFLVNPRTFMRGGVNLGVPPYLLKEDEWLDSRNFVFDYDRAKAVAPRQTIDQLVADMNSYTNTPTQGTGSNVPFPPNPFLPVVVDLVRYSAPSVYIVLEIAALPNIISFGATGLPAGLTLDTTTGVITGVLPATITTYNIITSATNANGVGYGYITVIVRTQYSFSFFDDNDDQLSSFVREVSVDGGDYAPVSYVATYSAFFTIKMRTRLVSPAIFSLFYQWRMGFVGTRPTILIAGSSLSLNGTSTTGFPRAYNGLYNGAIFSPVIDHTFGVGETFNLTADISGVMLAGYVGCYHDMARFGGFSSMVMESIFNF